MKQEVEDFKQDVKDFKQVQNDFNNDVLDGLGRQEGDIQEAQDRLNDIKGRLDLQDRNLGRKVRRLEAQMVPATDNLQYLKQEVENADVNYVDYDMACALCSTGRYKSLLEHHPTTPLR